MTEPTGADQSDVSDGANAPARRLVTLARPHPNESVEEFSARFLAEIRDAQQAQKSPGSDRD